jgi:hypothetical protein
VGCASWLYYHGLANGLSKLHYLLAKLRSSLLTGEMHVNFQGDVPKFSMLHAKTCTSERTPK